MKKLKNYTELKVSFTLYLSLTSRKFLVFYRIHYLKTNPERKTLPKKFHRNFQLDLAKNLLRKSAPKPPLTELHNPLLGIDLEKENRSPTPIRRTVCHYCVKGKKKCALETSVIVAVIYM